MKGSFPNELVCASKKLGERTEHKIGKSSSKLRNIVHISIEKSLEECPSKC